MKRVMIECPTCHHKKLQGIPPQLMEERNQCEKGIVAVLIPTNIVCGHIFIIYIDQNFAIREYLTPEHAQELNKKKIIQFHTIEDMLQKMKPDVLDIIKARL
jgi:hypothetical protein